MVKRITSGVSLYIQGLKFWYGDRKLVRLSFLPLIINLTLNIGLLTVTWGRLPFVFEKIFSLPQFWYQIVLVALGKVLVGGLLLFLTVLSATILASLINVPFYDYLTENALIKIRNRPTEGSQNPVVKRVWINFKAMCKRALLILGLSMILAILGFIPLLGIAVAPIGIMIICLDMVDFTFDHFNYTFRHRREFIQKYFLEFVGFSIGAGILGLIPFFNLILMPAQVVAASYWAARLEKSQI